VRAGSSGSSKRFGFKHRAGRRLTDEIERAATGTRLKDANSRRRLSASLRAFVAMYRPHAAREDTVLFPAFHKLVSRGEYDALGEQFEDEERRRFGQDGFESVLEEVARLERTLGIDDLRRFTPA
jgi:hemerythrin-like domain-containing protein